MSHDLARRTYGNSDHMKILGASLAGPNAGAKLRGRWRGVVALLQALAP
jgi:hypothetical protein